jgi:1-acyl-sn-glycerol-3-phosphate acyltransferase
MLTFQVVKDSALLVNVSALLFILPFFLFSAIGGQLGDKLEKSSFIRKVKLAEIGIMIIGALFFIFEITYGLMGILFLMGAQSAIFGPVKYSILPQHLGENQLLKGNAYVETGTFIAILLGTIFAGVIIQFDELSKYLVSGAVILFSILGYISSRFIPEGKPNNKDLKVNYNIFSETFNMVKRLKDQKKSVSKSILGISWFWFFGAVLMTQFPVFTKDFLHSGETVVILLLTLFSVGIGIGSILTEKLSDGDIELGLVPVGALGLTLGVICLYFSTLGLPAFTNESLLTASQFMAIDNAWKVIGSIFIIGIFGGFYTVPLYTLVQMRTEDSERSRVIAINNIINALFMVVSAIYSILMLNYLTVLELLLSVAIINILISVYIFTIVPEFAMRFIVMMILKCMYRIKGKNLNIPKEGKLIVVGNHVTFMDALILSAAIKRPMRFVMYYKIFNIPVLNFIFRQTRAIPIAGYKEDERVFNAAFDEIEKALKNDEAVFIFPEGKLTTDGDVDEFKGGVEKIIKRTPAPVYTVALQGVWGSFFSKIGKVPFKRVYSKVTVVGGELVQPEDATKENLEEIVIKLVESD